MFLRCCYVFLLSVFLIHSDITQAAPKNSGPTGGILSSVLTQTPPKTSTPSQSTPTSGGGATAPTKTPNTSKSSAQSGQNDSSPNSQKVFGLGAGVGSRNSCFAVAWQPVSPSSLRHVEPWGDFNGLLNESNPADRLDEVQILVGTNNCTTIIYEISASCNRIATSTNETLGFDLATNARILKPKEGMVIGFKFRKTNFLNEYDKHVPGEYSGSVPVEFDIFNIAVYSAVDNGWYKSNQSFFEHYKTFEKRLNVVMRTKDSPSYDVTIGRRMVTSFPNPDMARYHGLANHSCSDAQLVETWSDGKRS